MDSLCTTGLEIGKSRHKGVPYEKGYHSFRSPTMPAIFESYGYEDTARKFSVFSLLRFWIAAAWGEWKSYRESEEQLKGRSGLVPVDHSTLSKKASRVPFRGISRSFSSVVKRCPRRNCRMLSLPFFVFAVDSTIITVGKIVFSGRLACQLRRMIRTFRGKRAVLRVGIFPR